MLGDSTKPNSASQSSPPSSSTDSQAEQPPVVKNTVTSGDSGLAQSEATNRPTGQGISALPQSDSTSGSSGTSSAGCTTRSLDQSEATNQPTGQDGTNIGTLIGSSTTSLHRIPPTTFGGGLASNLAVRNGVIGLG